MKGKKLLLWGTGFLMALSIYTIFMYVPTEDKMGIVQRIFYIHVSLGMVFIFAFFVVFCASIMYLWKKNLKWDRIAHSSVEIGLLFCTLVLITGPIWARPIWGTWWTWDARLTSTLILWFMYIAYLMLGASSHSQSAGAKFRAVFGIIAFVDVPIVFMSIRWWRSIHPVVLKSNKFDMDPRMLHSFFITMGAVFLLYLVLMQLLVSIKCLSSKVEELEILMENKTAKQ